MPSKYRVFTHRTKTSRDKTPTAGTLVHHGDDQARAEEVGTADVAQKDQPYGAYFVVVDEEGKAVASN